MSFGQRFKTTYVFAEKARNLEINKKYGGARAAGWDQHQIEEALEDIRNYIGKNYQGKKVLLINLKYVKRIIKGLEIAVGSIKVEDDLADTIIREVEKQQQKIHQEMKRKQLKLIDELIPELDQLLPDDCKVGSIKQILSREGSKNNSLRSLKRSFSFSGILRKMNRKKLTVQAYKRALFKRVFGNY